MIKEARKKQRLTQKELAIKSNLPQSFLSELESRHKKKNVTIKQIINISNKLKISPYELSDWLIDKELNKVEFSEELGVFKIG